MKTGNDRNNPRKLSKLFWIGFFLFIFGTGPLLIIIAQSALGMTKDSNPNPVGFGIMAMLTFWPGIGMMIAGLINTYKRKNR